MSLQTINHEMEAEVSSAKKQRSGLLRSAFKKIRSNSVGSILRGTYPDPKRLEEILSNLE